MVLIEKPYRRTRADRQILSIKLAGRRRAHACFFRWGGAVSYGRLPACISLVSAARLENAVTKCIIFLMARLGAYLPFGGSAFSFSCAATSSYSPSSAQPVRNTSSETR